MQEIPKHVNSKCLKLRLSVEFTERKFYVDVFFLINFMFIAIAQFNFIATRCNIRLCFKVML